jgi:hypothetical protein
MGGAGAHEAVADVNVTAMAAASALAAQAGAVSR